MGVRQNPKAFLEEDWIQISPDRPLAIRCTKEDYVYLRLGSGKGFYLELASNQLDGKIVNALDYETGASNLLHQIKNRESYVLGRGSDAQIKLIHVYVSRHHAEIRLRDDILLVRDLGSVNGTFCFKRNIHFDVEAYLEKLPEGNAVEQTLDEIHNLFGASLDPFLKQYKEQKNNDSRINNSAPAADNVQQKDQL